MLYSVVMPTHNRLHLLREAIETVRRQEFSDWELVVFDNASTDPIRGHVHGLNDERVHYARSDKFLPVTDSWNRAIELARGDYVVLLGDDDGVVPNYFKRLQEIVEKFNRPDVVYNNIYQFWHPGVAPWEPSGYLIDVKHGFFFVDRDVPFLLSQEEARDAALGSINLQINFSFNSQAFVYKRDFLTKLCTDGPVYRSPFPDYYIANVALMRSSSTVVVPEPLAIAGISKASFGFTMYNGEEKRGAALLNTDLLNDPIYRVIESQLLPGPEYNTNFVVAMEYVARALPQLRAAVDFKRYRRIQIFAALKGIICGESAGDAWSEVRKSLSRSERLWASTVFRALRLIGHFAFAKRHLLPRLEQSVSMSGFAPMVRHCGKHNFKRVTQLYDVLATGATTLEGYAESGAAVDSRLKAVMGDEAVKSVLFYPELAENLAGEISARVRPIDPALVSRIRRAYHLAVASFDGYGESGWSGIAGLSIDVHACLMNGADADLAAMLENPGGTDLFYGFDTLVRGTQFDLSSLTTLLAMIFDGFVRLAESIGAENIWNEDATENILVARPRPYPGPINEILTKIEAVIGVTLNFPNPFPREGGLATARGIACYRVPHAIYQAWRVRTLAGQTPTAKVLEIGAGLGRTAYYAKRFGAANYTIVDLPLTNVAQSLFLGQTLGPDAIWVPGDPLEKQAGRIRIVPPSWFHETDELFEVVLNADSMTEMDRGHAAAYVEKISRKPCTFLSINHENNAFTVSELCDTAARTGRFPYWLRKGYVEEIFTFGVKAK